MKSYQDTFKKIITFNSIESVNTFAKEAYALDNSLKEASATVE